MKKLLMYVLAVLTAFGLTVLGVYQIKTMVSDGVIAGLCVSVWSLAATVICLRAAMFVSGWRKPAVSV